VSTRDELLRLTDLVVKGKEASTASPLAAEVTALFDDTHHSLLRYLLSFGLTPQDGEEVLQEVFLALFQHLRHEKPRTNLRAWLFRVAHNLGLKRLLMLRRDAQATAVPTQQWEETAADPAPNPEALARAAQVHRRLQAVLKVLPEQDRRCLVLRAEGLRYRDIAQVLDMSLGAVSNSITRSLARLARAMEQ
jgi:RNA polymerase sigma-70 factor, ECF subfamily